MDRAGSAHALNFAGTAQPITAIVMSHGVKVEILDSKAWVVVVQEHMRVVIAVAKGRWAAPHGHG